MSVLDNQQVTISWFVGMLEGEGCFQGKSGKGVSISITNTDLDIIDACERFLKSHYIYYTTTKFKRPTRKEEYYIYVRKTRDIFDYSRILYDLIQEKMECRITAFQRIIGTSETIRSPSIDLDWLIGIFEAEGSFSLNRNNQNVANMRIDICNTDFSILNKVIKILSHYGCPYFVEDKVRKDHWKPAKAVSIWGMKRCRRFLRLTEGKWLAKRNIQRTNLMLEFMASRFSRDLKSPTSDREYDIFRTMKELNTRGGM